MAIDETQIARMSRDEKLQMMEALWADLSRDEASLASPEWHEDALRETASRLDSGNELIIDWDEAKRDLRKRFD